MTRLLTVILATMFLVACAGSSTVTVGGRPVSMPKKAADEHEKLIENVGIYDDPELPLTSMKLQIAWSPTRVSRTRNSPSHCSIRQTSTRSLCRAG